MQTQHKSCQLKLRPQIMPTYTKLTLKPITYNDEKAYTNANATN